jgi:glyoxylase-like metal-dependent hydrolase (beta-lactamase superfamily II)
VPFIENYSSAAADDDRFAMDLMIRHGIPEEVARALGSVSAAFRGWGAKAKITRPLRDGETIEFRDRSLKAHFRPGHSPTDTVFEDAERKTLLAADHLLAHISSNPLIARPQDGSERPQALVTYMESLRKTRAMDLDLVLPGHGDPITDHRALIDQRFEMHARRAEKLYELIEERSRTAHELAQALWGNIAVTQAYLTLSEVLGHTDLLVNEGRVRQVEEGSVVRFEAIR